MNTNAKEQIEYIDRSLEWIKKHRPQDLEGKFLGLVEKRRELRKIMEAERDNPAIAAYGISQVGKSYLMNNILQQTVIKDGKKIIIPFEVDTPKGKIRFIRDINPVTIEGEATGVITRFTSFNKEPNRYSKDYPVLMKCLSISDITLVFCDGYFKDTRDYNTDKLEDINAKAKEIYAKYISRQPLSFCPVTADDVLDMKEYFKTELNEAKNINDSDFFTKLAVVIDRVPVDDYPGIFTYLWHNSKFPDNDQYINNLYGRLLNVYKKLEYKKDVYLPIDAVLNKADGSDDIENERTIMSVECLNGLGKPDFAYKCEAFVKNSDGTFKSIGTINKSELAALCAEVRFYINKSFWDNKSSYSIDGSITDPKVKEIIKKGEIEYDFLKTTDLLDFPGARSRLNKEGIELQNAKTLIEVLLRGKVAYLFNKYSEAKVINILLYCHHVAQTEVTFLQSILKEWVRKYIGATTNERAKTLVDTGGISPLFYIATKFNLDLSKKGTKHLNERSSIDRRWYDRFTRNVRIGIFNSNNADCWVNNYTGEGQMFQNSYLLRDYSWSAQLYTGFAQEGRETGYFVDQANQISFDEEYRKQLRDSFTESKDVKLLFKNPALSWDLATTMNNDGALYIIENLTKCASAIGTVRSRQFSEQCAKIANSVLREIEDYYEPENESQKFAKDKKSCREIIFQDLVDACNNDQIFFSFLLQKFQLKPEVCKNYIRQEVIPNLASHTAEEGKFDMYHREYDFKKEDSREVRLQKLLKCTGLPNEEEARKWFAEKKGINLDDLLASEVQSVSYSSVISKKVYDDWIKKLNALDNLIDYRSYDPKIKRKSQLDSGNFSKIRMYLINAAKYVNLSEKMKKAISDVDGMGVKLDSKVPRISDILATIINNFVVDFGYEYLTKEEREKAKVVFQDETDFLKKIDSITTPRRKEVMFTFLQRVLDNDTSLKEPFLDRYDKWVGCMLTAVVASAKVKIHTPEIIAANAEIKPIIEGLKKSI